MKLATRTPALAAHHHRERAGQAPVAAGDLDGELRPLAVVPPPLGQPAVQQERARARHRADEVVPFAGQRLECLDRGHGLDGRDRLGYHRHRLSLPG